MQSVERIQLTPTYSISRLIKGGWHLAGGHGPIDKRQAVEDMRVFVEKGITTFDCADIYTGVEELIGSFMKKYGTDIRNGILPSVQIHTKYVPDYDALGSLTKQDTEKIIDRSLMRLNVERLDLVQFAWWNYEIPGHIDAAGHLKELQDAGKIRYLGVTNCDAKHLQELLDAGIKIVANQVQYSILDRRPEKALIPLCGNHNIALLCYGVVGGGFFSDRYLGVPLPTNLENRSLIKYQLIIDEFGGYESFQEALSILSKIAKAHQVGIAEIAIKYILQKAQVAAAIIGARNVDHLSSMCKIDGIKLSQGEVEDINQLSDRHSNIEGPVYELERQKSGKHGAIMRYNLNGQRTS